MKKKLFLILFSVFLALPLSARSDLAFVNDGADLLFDFQEESLDAKATEIGQLYNCGVYLVTVDNMADYGYSDIEEFSEYWYSRSGYGIGPERTGIMLILSMADRDYDICAYGPDAHYAFTDYGKKWLAESFLGPFGDDEYGIGFTRYLRSVERLLEMAAEGNPYDVGVKMKKPLYVSFFFALIIGAVIALISCFTMKAKMGRVKEAAYASEFIPQNGIDITRKLDRFTHTTETRTKIESSSSSSSGGGGTTISSGGYSHSSGKF